jgi:hypothetical protein
MGLQTFFFLAKGHTGYCGLDRRQHVGKQQYVVHPNGPNYCEIIVVHTRFTNVVAGRRLETCGMRLILTDRCLLPAKVNGLKNFHYSSLMNLYFTYSNITPSAERLTQVPVTFSQNPLNELL